MNFVAVIPARLDSRRLPGKVLREAAGKPLVQWVHDNVKKAKNVGQVYIATDSPEVEAACRGFTQNIFFSNQKHICGTDRVAEVAGSIDADVFINIQSDEPMMDPALIDGLTELFKDPSVHMASAVAPIHSVEDFVDPNVVKVVVDRKGDALYFSRAPIPWFTENLPGRDSRLPDDIPVYKHIGIYAYRKECLLSLAALSRTDLESSENLEQLRAQEYGWKIRILMWDYHGIGIDTEEDLEKLRRKMGMANINPPACKK